MANNTMPSRGSGFIISGGNTTVEKKIIHTPPRIIKKHTFSFPIGSFISECAGKLCHGFGVYASEATKINKRFFKLALSFTVAVSSICVFFNYFTFATAIYNPNKCIGISSSVKEFDKALAKAKERVRNTDAVFLTDFKTSSVIVLKSKVYSVADLSDKLILSSPNFKEACVVLADGNTLFTATSKKEATTVINEYVSSLSMNGETSIEEKLEFTKQIVQSSSILSKEECKKILTENQPLEILSVVSSSYEEAVPFAIQSTPDDMLYVGEKVVLSEGKAGTKKVLQETVYKNGAEQSSKIVSESIITTPVAKIVKVGTKAKDILKTGVIRPVKSGWVSSNYGARWGRTHEGIDIAVSTGSEVLAAECGTVCYVSENAGGYGKYIEIDHGNGMKTAYAHLSKILVTKGSTVSAGDKIALSGNTGNSTGPHLHFEIINNGKRIDPKPYINGL